jgi:CheY-like chemotaxis protein
MPSQILILDDEKNYLLILDAMLTDAGYAVTALDDPRRAWPIWRSPRWTWSSRT